MLLTVNRAFLRNPVKYPDPENFRPERWLEPGWPSFQEPLTQFPTINGMTSFGWGQRACLGQSVTRDETIVATGALLWGFNLKHKKDAHGNDIPASIHKSNSLLIVKPDAWDMAFEPRSNERAQSMRNMWADSEAQDMRERMDFAKNAKVAREATIDITASHPADQDAVMVESSAPMAFGA